MTPSHAVKNGKRYRHYVSGPLTTQRRADCAGRRVPAGDIERIVINRIRMFLFDPTDVFATIEPYVHDARDQKELVERAARLADRWRDMASTERRGILLRLVERIEVHAERVDVVLVPARLAESPTANTVGLTPASQSPKEMVSLTLSTPARHKRTGMETRMIIEGPGASDHRTTPNASLIKLVLKAHQLHARLIDANGESLSELAEREGIMGSYFTRLVRLAFLAPDITQAILEGRHPPDLTAARLMRDTRFPLEWTEQRKLLGFA